MNDDADTGHPWLVIQLVILQGKELKKKGHFRNTGNMCYFRSNK